MSLWSDDSTIATAVLAALTGAVLKGLFDQWVEARRLRFARQQKRLDAQWALLDELGRVCWEMRFSAFRVAYHWLHSQSEAYDKASKNYVENCWTSFNNLRFIGTRADRLFSRSASKAVDTFYDRLNAVDSTIEEAIRERDIEKRGSLFKKALPEIDEKLRTEIRELLQFLSKEASL